MALKLEVGKTYETRDGEYHFKITWNRSPHKYPVVAVCVKSNKVWFTVGEIRGFTDNGFAYAEQDQSKYDLVKEVQ